MKFLGDVPVQKHQRQIKQEINYIKIKQFIHVKNGNLSTKLKCSLLNERNYLPIVYLTRIKSQTYKECEKIISQKKKKKETVTIWLKKLGRGST